MDEIDNKLAQMKAESAVEKVATSVAPGNMHEITSVASGTIMKPEKKSVVGNWIKGKMKDTAINVLEPMAKDLLFNTLQDLASRMIYKNGSGYSAPPGRYNNSGYRDYSTRSRFNQSRGYSTGGNNGSIPISDSDDFHRTGSIYDYRQFAVNDIRDVNKVYDELNAAMFKYHNVTVADVYRALGNESKIINTDLNWGWSIDDFPNGLPARYSWVSYGEPGQPKRTKYRLDLPEPEALD